MGDLFDFFEGNEATTQTRTSRAGSVRRRPTSVSSIDTTGTGMPDDRTPGAPSTLPTGNAYNAWRQYVRNNHRLEQIWDDESRGEWTSLTHKRFYTDRDKREFDNLQRDIRAYQQNQQSCDLGDAAACQAVGRRDRNDRPIYNSNPDETQAIIREETGGSATSQEYWNNRVNNQYTSSLDSSPPRLEPSGQSPGDIMGDGTSTRPADAPPRDPDPQGGASGLIPAPPSDPPPHSDRPEDRTGEQVPSDAHTGHDDQKHRSSTSGGGMHDGSAGSGSNTGSHEVEHFDSGGKPMSALARQANPVKQMLNLIGALQDPYGQFRKCNTEKRLVE